MLKGYGTWANPEQNSYRTHKHKHTYLIINHRSERDKYMRSISGGTFLHLIRATRARVMICRWANQANGRPHWTRDGVVERNVVASLKNVIVGGRETG